MERGARTGTVRRPPPAATPDARRAWMKSARRVEAGLRACRLRGFRSAGRLPAPWRSGTSTNVDLLTVAGAAPDFNRLPVSPRARSLRAGHLERGQSK